MAIDDAAKRRAAAGLAFIPLPQVTPDGTPGVIWRQQTVATYSGIGLEAFQQFGVVTRSIDPASYDGTFYLEVMLKTSDSGFPVKARVYNVTTGAVVSGSEVQTTGTSATRVRSTGFSLTAGANVYRIEIGGVTNGGTYTCYDAVLLAGI